MAPPSLVSRLVDMLETDAPDVQKKMSVVDDVNSDLQADVFTLQEEVDMADEFKSSQPHFLLEGKVGLQLLGFNFLTNSDFNIIGPMPSILQSIL